MKEVEQEDIIVQFQLDGKSLHSSITKAVIHLRSSIPTLIIELFARMANELSIYRTQSLGSAFAKVSRSPSYMTILVKSPEIGYRTIAPEMFLQSLLFNWYSVVTQKSFDFMMYSEFDTFHKFNFSEKLVVVQQVYFNMIMIMFRSIWKFSRFSTIVDPAVTVPKFHGKYTSKVYWNLWSFTTVWHQNINQRDWSPGFRLGVNFFRRDMALVLGIWFSFRGAIFPSNIVESRGTCP